MIEMRFRLSCWLLWTLALGVLSTAACALAADEPAAGGRRFDILEYSVEGNTVLPALAIERAIYPHLGPGRSAQDVDRAREALEKAYQDAGYLTVLVEVPEQKVTEGTVVLRVTEGKVDRLKVSGAEYSLPSRIREQTPSLAAGEVPYFPDVQQEIAQAGRSPDLRLTPMLRPGRTPGTVEVELKVEDRLPLHGSVELNNKRSPDTQRGRIEANVRYDNLWQRRHSFGLSVFMSPSKREEAEVFGANYAFPLTDGGSQLALFATHSNSNIPTAFDTSVLGKGTVLGARWVLPLPARGQWFHSFNFGLDRKDFAQTVNVLSTVLVEQPVRYVPLAAQYSATSLDEGGEFRFGLGATAGLRGLSDRVVSCNGVPRDQFDCRRAGARSNFAVLRGELQRTQALPAGFGAYLRIDGQASSQPLISNEQLAAGGADSVRGYLEAEQSGDYGWRARIELRSPSAAAFDEGLRASALVFYDQAQLRLHEPLPGQQATFRLASAGLGLRLRAGRHLVADIDWARALADGSRTRSGDNVIHMQMAYEF